MKTWTMELTSDELIALAKVCCDWQETKTATGHITIEDLQTLKLINEISEKMPEEDWFPEEVRV